MVMKLVFSDCHALMQCSEKMKASMPLLQPRCVSRFRFQLPETNGVKGRRDRQMDNITVTCSQAVCALLQYVHLQWAVLQALSYVLCEISWDSQRTKQGTQEPAGGLMLCFIFPLSQTNINKLSSHRPRNHPFICWNFLHNVGDMFNPGLSLTDSYSSSLGQMLPKVSWIP